MSKENIQTKVDVAKRELSFQKMVFKFLLKYVVVFTKNLLTLHADAS